MGLRTKIYVFDPNLADGDGVYSPSDWGKTRRASEISDVYHDPTDDNYRKAIAARPEKISLAQDLCDLADFSRFSAIGEIGGAPYIQAQHIKSVIPGLIYLATDQDAQSNAVLRQVPMLSSLDIRTFNLRSDDPGIFESCELIVSFAVDYALTDADISKLLSYLARTGKAWAMLSVSVVDFPRFMRFRLGYWMRRLLGRPQRFHGWARGMDVFHQMAAGAGVRLEDRGTLGAYRVLWFSGNVASAL